MSAVHVIGKRVSDLPVLDCRAILIKTCRLFQQLNEGNRGCRMVARYESWCAQEQNVAGVTSQGQDSLTATPPSMTRHFVHLITLHFDTICDWNDQS